MEKVKTHFLFLILLLTVPYFYIQSFSLHHFIAQTKLKLIKKKIQLKRVINEIVQYLYKE